jgi:2-polyprenyl-3-methyl-5-hydroxy-6-metoxy-1,4-benzoquinol methylase
LWRELIRGFRDSASSAERAYEREFHSREDPWNYLAAEEERSRFRAALSQLDTCAPNDGFERVLEVGCAEGAFTTQLAQRARHLLAVDISPTALERARERCSDLPHVSVERWDLRRDPVLASFELVTVMDVLDCFYRPSDVRSALRKIAASVAPGGYLLISARVQNETVETAPWASRLVRGGSAVTSAVERHTGFGVVARGRSEAHLITLFERRRTSRRP